MPYFLAPFIGWFVSGCLKYAINSVRFGRHAAKDYAGNGGFPSTHTSTIATVIFLIGLGEGWLSPVFGLGVGVLFIIIIDATGLRRAVGRQATLLNKAFKEEPNHTPLRERMGHNRIEVLGGLVVGFITALVLYFVFNSWGWV